MLFSILTAVILSLPTVVLAQNTCQSVFSSNLKASQARTNRSVDRATAPKNETRSLRTISDRDVANGFADFVSEDAYYGLQSASGLSIQITRTDSWGARKEFAGKGLEVSIPVANREQGNAILRDLLDPVGVDSSPLTGDVSKRGAKLSDGIFVQFETPKETAGGIEPSMRLVLSNQSSQSLEAGALIMNALVRNGLYQKNLSEVGFDMNSNTGRHEWAVRSFKGNRNLTDDEYRSLYEIGVGDFRTINGSLRRSDGVADRRVPFIDSAIAKGKTDRAVKIYRSVHREDLLKIWDEMAAGSKALTTITPDPAYLFGSLDPAVARWWQHSWNDRADGVILEIELPKGTQAAYLDSRIHERRGYLEVILARNAKLMAISSSRDGDYRVLRVRLQK